VKNLNFRFRFWSQTKFQYYKDCLSTHQKWHSPHVINILRANFWYKSASSSFSLITLWLLIFVANILAQKSCVICWWNWSKIGQHCFSCNNFIIVPFRPWFYKYITTILDKKAGLLCRYREQPRLLREFLLQKFHLKNATHAPPMYSLFEQFINYFFNPTTFFCFEMKIVYKIFPRKKLFFYLYLKITEMKFVFNCITFDSSERAKSGCD